jgi:hypothetical protein
MIYGLTSAKFLNKCIGELAGALSHILSENIMKDLACFRSSSESCIAFQTFLAVASDFQVINSHGVLWLQVRGQMARSTWCPKKKYVTWKDWQ